MTERIYKLTKAQEDAILDHVAKWIKIGLSCEPLNEEAALAAALKCYEAAGLALPKYVVYARSPMGLVYSCPLVLKVNESNSSVRSSVESSVGNSVRDSVRSSVENSVESSVGNSVRDSVWNSVRSSVWNSVWNSVASSVESSVWNSVESSVGNSVESSVWKDSHNNLYRGQFWANWVAYVDFFVNQCDLEINTRDKFEFDKQLSESCGYLWWHEDVIGIADRPAFIKKDDEGRLHCETGHAIEYRDGWGVSSWHGTIIPDEWLIDKQSLTAAKALAWPNLEQRRIACSDIVGWAKILNELNAKVIDEDGDPQIGTLLEVQLPDLTSPVRFCKVKCGTGREFAVGVPREVKTALEAQAWMQGIELKNFMKPEVRT